MVQYWFENRIFVSTPNHRERTLVARITSGRHFGRSRSEPSANISPGSRIERGSYVGAMCSIEADVLLENSILFPGSFIPRGTTLRSCIVGGVKVEPGTYQDTDFL